MIQNGQRYLITTDHWFFAPDGESYRSAWGTCEVLNIKEVFGFVPARPSTNWYLRVGCCGREIIIAGCQIHYAVRCEEKPQDNRAGKTYREKDTDLEAAASRIYIAEAAHV